MQWIKSTSIYQEWQVNKRLQWMVVGIAAIIFLSLAKSCSDSLNAQGMALQNQMNLTGRLEQAANAPFDPAQLEQSASQLNVLTSSLPSSPSSSVAEAKALADIDALVGKYIKRKRLNLIGSDQVVAGNQLLWSVRIDVAGQLAEEELINILALFDRSIGHRRIASLQYSPKTSNSINLVIDVLFKQASNE